LSRQTHRVDARSPSRTSTSTRRWASSLQLGGSVLRAEAGARCRALRRLHPDKQAAHLLKRKEKRGAVPKASERVLHRLCADWQRQELERQEQAAELAITQERERERHEREQQEREREQQPPDLERAMKACYCRCEQHALHALHRACMLGASAVPPCRARHGFPARITPAVSVQLCMSCFVCGGLTIFMASGHERHWTATFSHSKTCDTVCSLP